MNRSANRFTTAAVGVVALTLTLAGCSAGGADSDGPVELTLLTGTVEANVMAAQGVADAFNASQDEIVVTLDSSVPSGSEGDNLMKTQLATGEMTDMFWYNSGSLFQALSPDKTLLNLDDQPWVDSLHDAFAPTVSTENGVYGAPIGTAMGGGVFYWIPDYEELGLEVPTTWDEFISNAEALKAAGKDAIIQSYGDPWTSQIFVLADFFNVNAQDPDWAESYTANEVRYSEEPALEGFEYLQEVSEKGLMNEDYASLMFADALNRIGQGEGTHYPMLTFAIDTIKGLFPENLDKVGFFALPGDGPNGLTVWMPPAVYAPKDTEHPEEVKEFLAFLASPAGCDALTDAVSPSGPYVIEGCTIPDDVPRAVADMLPYFEQKDGTSPALEFQSPIKGTALEQITVEVGSGIRSAIEGAKLYDADVEKQAQQLGLPGW